MHLEILVEEPSAEAALQNLLPAIIDQEVTFAIHAHQGKPDLLKKLPGKLKGYQAWLPPDGRIVVLVDRDEEDCESLKAGLEQIARDVGLTTRSMVGPGPTFQVLNRLAIEELEAWFFGDIEALHRAYPRIPLNLRTKAKFRDPDAIAGGTWETLERELQRKGYHRGGLQKISASRAISAHMDPGRNKSKSFQVFRRGLLELIR
ncbi:MAG: DUF4276 family protein [Deltaproteobacteria bacterium]|nr:DUF4276 family protein [Deltaproteobacteria bacterium]